MSMLTYQFYGAAQLSLFSVNLATIVQSVTSRCVVAKFELKVWCYAFRIRNIISVKNSTLMD